MEAALGLVAFTTLEAVSVTFPFSNSATSYNVCVVIRAIACAGLHTSTHSSNNLLHLLTDPPHPLSIRTLSHLAALHNTNIMHRPIPFCRICPDLLHLAHHVLTLNHPAKHDVLPVEEWCRRTRDEELTAISVGAGIRHRKQEGSVVLVREVLVGEAVRVFERVDGRRARAVGVQEVAALDHKGLDDAVEFRVLVALHRRGWRSAVADAELPEVFSRQRRCRRVEEHLDPAKWFACVLRNIR